MLHTYLLYEIINVCNTCKQDFEHIPFQKHYFYKLFIINYDKTNAVTYETNQMYL